MWQLERGIGNQICRFKGHRLILKTSLMWRNSCSLTLLVHTIKSKELYIRPNVCLSLYPLPFADPCTFFILVLVVFRSSKCAKENDKLCGKEGMPACWQEKDVPVLQQQITKCYKFMYVIVYSDCPGDCCPEKDCCG